MTYAINKAGRTLGGQPRAPECEVIQTKLFVITGWLITILMKLLTKYRTFEVLICLEWGLIYI